jgi:glycosyltransferase involved in cell wall biosynthesis
MKIIFYHPSIIGRKNSGSGIRPLKMLSEFKKCNFSVVEISGSISERKKLVSNVKDLIRNGDKFDLVYFENLSTPVTLRWVRFFRFRVPLISLFDLFFLRFCLNNKIKVAYFFRDIHWDFESLYHGIISKRKVQVIRFFGLIELLFLKLYVKNVFVPSDYFARYLKEKFGITSKELAPGSDIQTTSFPTDDSLPLTFLYVGGCGPLYDPKVLFNAFSLLDKNSKSKLLFCTRKEEWGKFKHKYGSSFENNFISILHFDGDDLINLYNQSSVAIYSLPPHPYTRMASAIKIPEYIMAGKPIIAYEGSTVANLILKYDIGWVIPYDANVLKSLINHLSIHRHEILNKRFNVLKYQHEFSWGHVVSNLMDGV